jgi:hypothetical protein
MLYYNFFLEYAIRKVEETQVELKLNRTHTLLAYAVDVNPLRDDIDIRKEKKSIIDIIERLV